MGFYQADYDQASAIEMVNSIIKGHPEPYQLSDEQLAQVHAIQKSSRELWVSVFY